MTQEAQSLPILVRKYLICARGLGKAVVIRWGKAVPERLRPRLREPRLLRQRLFER
jgi:hypothetical protein